MIKVIPKALRWTGVFAGAVAVYLLTVALTPGFPEPRQELTPKPRPPDEPDTTCHSRREPIGRGNPHGAKENVRFASGGTGMHGSLYLPQDVSAPVPCIVMAHGLGGTVDTGLDAYARRFQKTGYAALAFDYRYLSMRELHCTLL